MATQDSEFDLKAKPEEGNGDIVTGIVGTVNFRRAMVTL